MQQINLYQSVLHKKQNRLAPALLARYGVTAAAVLAVISAVLAWQYYGASHELEQLKLSQAALLQEVQKVSAELSAISDDSVLLASITKKEKELANRQNVLQVLSGKHFGNAKGFASHFVGLSRQHIDGVWLTSLHIHSGGTRLNLSGSTYTPEDVPKYLQKLSEEPGFRGLEFKTFLMQRKDKSSLVNFDIRSKQAEPG